MSERIALIGFSTTGKSAVGRLLAERLGWQFIDTDEDIVRRAGRPIPEIFAQDGEERFRELESEAVRLACAQERVVIATGGGIVLREVNRRLLHEATTVICLEAQPETIYRRLQADLAGGSPAAVRPLLAGKDPLARIRALKEFRQPYYAIGHWTVHTDGLAVEQVVTEVLQGYSYVKPMPAPRVEVPAVVGAEVGRPSEPGPLALSELPEGREADMPYCETSGAIAVVRAPGGSYPVFAGIGLLADLGWRLRNAGLAGTAWVVSDEHVLPAHGPAVDAVLRSAGFGVHALAIPAGEEAKSLETVRQVYDWLVAGRAERGQALVALGGGVVGDLAGFVAATYLRGLPLVQVPTTLLAMVDAAIGGKTGVNLPQGKNLVGAFYQPRLVLADVETLRTLPPRELAAGWAEVVKYGLIDDPELFAWLESEAERLRALELEAAARAIGRSAGIKAAVVTEDEREEGRRVILNFGHTIAHGLEAATAYGQLLHGEAVAIGLVGACRLGARLDLTPESVGERAEALLVRLGLPVRAPQVPLEGLFGVIRLDKKVRRAQVRWVLLEAIGRPVVRSDVPLELVAEVLRELMA